MEPALKQWITCSDCGGCGQDSPFLEYVNPLKFPKPCYACGGSGRVLNPEWPVEVTVDNFTNLVASYDAAPDNMTYTLRVKAELRDGLTFGCVIARDAIDKTGQPLQIFLIEALNNWFRSKGQTPTQRSLLLYGPVALPPGYVSGVVNSWHAPTKTMGAPGGSQIVRELRRLLPELDKRVQCPVTLITEAGTERCGDSNSVYNTVIHLNDQHRWKREDIADWLETLDVDITFPTDPDSMPPAEEPKKKGCGCNLCQSGWSPGSGPVTFQFKAAAPMTFAKPAHDVVFIDDPVVDEIAAWGAANPLVTEAVGKSMLESIKQEMDKLTESFVVQKPQPLILPPWLADAMSNHVHVTHKQLVCTGDDDCIACVSFSSMPPEPAPKEKALQAKKEHAAKQQKLLEKLGKAKKGKGVK